MNKKTRKPKASKNKAKVVETCGVKVKLSVKDRMLMRNLMPTEGDIVTLTISRDIQAKVRLTQAELKKAGVKENKDAGGLKWDKDFEKTVIFSHAEHEFLKAEVSKLDSKKKVTPEILDLCVKIRG